MNFHDKKIKCEKDFSKEYLHSNIKRKTNCLKKCKIGFTRKYSKNKLRVCMKNTIQTQKSHKINTPSTKSSSTFFSNYQTPFSSTPPNKPSAFSWITGSPSKKSKNTNNNLSPFSWGTETPSDKPKNTNKNRSPFSWGSDISSPLINKNNNNNSTLLRTLNTPLINKNKNNNSPLLGNLNRKLSSPKVIQPIQKQKKRAVLQPVTGIERENILQKNNPVLHNPINTKERSDLNIFRNLNFHKKKSFEMEQILGHHDKYAYKFNNDNRFINDVIEDNEIDEHSDELIFDEDFNEKDIKLHLICLGIRTEENLYKDVDFGLGLMDYGVNIDIKTDENKYITENLTNSNNKYFNEINIVNKDLKNKEIYLEYLNIYGTQRGKSKYELQKLKYDCNFIIIGIHKNDFIGMIGFLINPNNSNKDHGKNDDSEKLRYNYLDFVNSTSLEFMFKQRTKLLQGFPDLHIEEQNEKKDTKQNKRIYVLKNKYLNVSETQQKNQCESDENNEWLNKVIEIKHNNVCTKKCSIGQFRNHYTQKCIKIR